MCTAIRAFVAQVGTVRLPIVTHVAVPAAALSVDDPGENEMNPADWFSWFATGTPNALDEIPVAVTGTVIVDIRAPQSVQSSPPSHVETSQIARGAG
jgi:hypothetical protein